MDMEEHTSKERYDDELDHVDKQDLPLVEKDHRRRLIPHHQGLRTLLRLLIEQVCEHFIVGSPPRIHTEMEVRKTLNPKQI